MPTATKPYKAKRRRKQTSWAVWLPVVVGVLATPLALHAASILALSGPGGLTLLYPLAQIVQTPALHLSGPAADQAAQWAMYLQFPLFSLFMTWMWRRSQNFLAALGVTALLYFAVWGAATLLLHMQNPMLRF